jgi:hypothetical protein
MRVYLDPFVSVGVDDFATASSVVTRQIDENNLSARDFFDEDGSLALAAVVLGVRHPYQGGEVLDESGSVIAIVSYNGRIWKPQWNSCSERWIASDDEIVATLSKSS